MRRAADPCVAAGYEVPLHEVRHTPAAVSIRRDFAAGTQAGLYAGVAFSRSTTKTSVAFGGIDPWPCSP